jgi:hypothetical protein
MKIRSARRPACHGEDQRAGDTGADLNSGEGGNAASGAALTRDRLHRDVGRAEQLPGETQTTREPLADTGKPVEKAASKPKSMAVFLQIALNRTTHAMITFVIESAGVSREEHGRTLVEIKTQRGCCAWGVEMAAGKRKQKVLDKLMRVNMDVELGRKIGCSSTLGDGSEFNASTTNAIAESCSNFTRAMLSKEHETFFMHEMMPVLRWAALIGSDIEKTETLEFSNILFIAVTFLEELGWEDHWFMQYANDMIFTLNWWTRKGFISLAEGAFENVPPDMLTEMRDVHSGPQGTLDAENLFNYYRSLAILNKGVHYFEFSIHSVSLMGGVLQRGVTAVGSSDLGTSLTYINEEFIFLSLEIVPPSSRKHI